VAVPGVVVLYEDVQSCHHPVDHGLVEGHGPGLEDPLLSGIDLGVLEPAINRRCRDLIRSEDRSRLFFFDSNPGSLIMLSWMNGISRTHRKT
jgi:hypothetical protein